MKGHRDRALTWDIPQALEGSGTGTQHQVLAMVQLLQ